jgi:hypothetical protein
LVRFFGAEWYDSLVQKGTIFYLMLWCCCFESFEMMEIHKMRLTFASGNDECEEFSKIEASISILLE